MSLVINTNVASLSAQNSMSKAQMDQNEAMERLTTGKRINTAADDAAGIAVANKMTSQVKGLNQAVRNANDGISMLQTAAGGLEESGNILQRMRELAVQSASGTYEDSTDRGAMQAEVEQLKQELDRIAETTTFNGQKILDGSKDDVSLQVGANANETIDFSIGSTASKELGGVTADIVGSVGETGTNTLFTNLQGLDGTAGSASMYINEINVGDVGTNLNTANNSLQDTLDFMNDNIGGVAELGAMVEWNAHTVGDGVLQGDEGLILRVAGLDVNNDDVATNLTDFRIQDTSSMDELVNKINETTGGMVTASLTDDGRLSLTSHDASQLQVIVSDAADVGVVAAGAGTTGTDAIGMDVGAAATFTQQAQLTVTAKPGVDDISISYDDATTEADLTGLNVQNGTGTLVGHAVMDPTVAVTVIEAGDVKINGAALSGYDTAVDYDKNGTASQENDMIAWLNSHSAETGVVASIDTGSGNNDLKLQSLDGSAISIDFKDDLSTAEATAIEDALGMYETNATHGSQGSVSSIDVSTAAGAQKAISVLDGAIEQVSEIQGELGAVNNRLDFTVSNLSNVSENASAAKSRIEDADFAAESANLSRAQVLQQASQAMLAQANAAPKQVMSLLQ